MKKSIILIYLEYIPIRLLFTLILLLPYPVALLIGKCLGLVLYYLIVPLRRTAMRHLDIAFGKEKDLSWRKNICKQHFIHLGKLILEVLMIPKLKEKHLLKRTEFDPGSEELLKRVMAEKKGIIVVTGHLGNWELMGLRASIHGLPMNNIYRPLDNPKLDKWMVSFRTKFGAKVIPKKDVLKMGLRSLKNAEMLTFLIDQNTSVGGYFVPFLGTMASTAEGPSFFIERVPSLCIFSWTYRDHHNRHHIVIEEIPVHDPPKKIPNREQYKQDSHKWAVMLTEKITESFEKAVRQHPEQWFWLHPRWRKRPEGEESLGI